MIQRNIFPETEHAREYAIRMTKSDAPPYEFDLVQEEIDALQAGKAIVLVVGHDQTDTSAIVLTRKSNGT